MHWAMHTDKVINLINNMQQKQYDYYYNNRMLWCAYRWIGKRSFILMVVVIAVTRCRLRTAKELEYTSGARKKCIFV